MIREVWGDVAKSSVGFFVSYAFFSSYFFVRISFVSSFFFVFISSEKRILCHYYGVFYARISNFANSVCIRRLNRSDSFLSRAFILPPFSFSFILLHTSHFIPPFVLFSFSLRINRISLQNGINLILGDIQCTYDSLLKNILFFFPYSLIIISHITMFTIILMLVVRIEWSSALHSPKCVSLIRKREEKNTHLVHTRTHNLVFSFTVSLSSLH